MAADESMFRFTAIAIRSLLDAPACERIDAELAELGVGITTHDIRWLMHYLQAEVLGYMSQVRAVPGACIIWHAVAGFERAVWGKWCCYAPCAMICIARLTFDVRVARPVLLHSGVFAALRVEAPATHASSLPC